MVFLCARDSPRGTGEKVERNEGFCAEIVLWMVDMDDVVDEIETQGDYKLTKIEGELILFEE